MNFRFPLEVRQVNTGLGSEKIKIVVRTVEELASYVGQWKETEAPRLQPFMRLVATDRRGNSQVLAEGLPPKRLGRCGALGYVPEDDGGGRSPELRQYLETILWAETDDDGEPLDASYGPDDFEFEAELRAKGELESFFRAVDKILEEQWREGERRDFDSTDVVHDFWLTRNGHGAGFWDRPEKYGEFLAKKLTTLAKKFGEVYVYETDDGKLAFG